MTGLLSSKESELEWECSTVLFGGIGITSLLGRKSWPWQALIR